MNDVTTCVRIHIYLSQNECLFVRVSENQSQSSKFRKDEVMLVQYNMQILTSNAKLSNPFLIVKNVR